MFCGLQWDNFMKKIILFFVFSLFFKLSAQADVMPFYVDSIKHTGMGVVNVGEYNVIYEEPSTSSKIISKVSYEVNGVVLHGNWYQVNRIFVAYSPRARLAYATVADEDGECWYKIYYDQSTGKTGWIKVEDRKQFFVWKDFLDYYGRKRGIYAFRDIPKQFRRLYSGPGDDSQIIQSFDYARHIYLKKVTGNWVLVVLEDLSNKTKVGWVRWRTPEGKLYYFPSIQETF